MIMRVKGPEMILWDPSASCSFGDGRKDTVVIYNYECNVTHELIFLHGACHPWDTFFCLGGHIGAHQEAASDLFAWLLTVVFIQFNLTVN